MTDERNFRSSYYEKVGCRGVEEKKSLEILMKEKPWDRVKLKQFCLRFTVPAAYRNLVWKVLLDILPVYPDSHQFVMEQRTEQYQDLMYAVEMYELVDINAPRCQVLLEMWLLENEERKPPLFPETNFSSADTFLPIVNTLLELYDDEVDVYWLAKSLTDVVRNMQRDLPKLKEAFTTMLEKEDGDLFNHLVEISALEVLPLTKWFNCCFAGVLDDTSLTKSKLRASSTVTSVSPSTVVLPVKTSSSRNLVSDSLPTFDSYTGIIEEPDISYTNDQISIWDKICSGAPKILSFAAVMLIVTLRRNILRSQNADEVLKCVSEIPEQCEEVVANKAIELWQYYGAQPQSDTLAKK